MDELREGCKDPHSQPTGCVLLALLLETLDLIKSRGGDLSGSLGNKKALNGGSTALIIVECLA
jgi:hypothetical protein